MRTSNKLKIVQIIILIYISILLSVQAAKAQGWGPGGPNGGGPPPPPGYCNQFPNDPACQNAVSVPIGSSEIMIGFAILSGLFFAYKLNGNSFKFKKS